MLEHHDPTNDLLDEVLSGAELRQILDMLGEREFGGGGGSRIGDIVEATGADPQQVGRLLADVRQVDFEEKWGCRIAEQGRQLCDHEGRIEQLETHRKQVDKPAGLNRDADDVLVELGTDDVKELRKMVEERRSARAVNILLVVGTLLMFAVCILYALLSA